MKKDYYIKNPVDQEWINNTVHLSQGDTFIIQGCLNDAYLIDVSNLRYGRVRRKWLVVVPEYANEWGDNLHALLTDNDKLAGKFITEYEKQQDSYNEEGTKNFDPDAGEYRYYPMLEGTFMKSFAQLKQEALEKLFGKNIA